MKADKVTIKALPGASRNKVTTSQRGAGKPAVSTSVKDRDKRFGILRDEPRGGKRKAGREDIRKEARRVNVPRQSRRPGERSR